MAYSYIHFVILILIVILIDILYYSRDTRSFFPTYYYSINYN
jgi:hypothetical protein